MDVKMMEIGKVYQDFLMIYEKKKLKAKTQKDYLALVLGDSTEKLPCKIWDSIDSFLYQEGDVVCVEVEIITWNNEKQIKINRHRKVEKTDEVNYERYIKSITILDQEKYIKNILTTIENIKNEKYKELLNLFFKDEEFLDKFKNAPAAMVHHQNFLGGLLTHTNNVLNICKDISKHYEGHINVDLLFTAAIFHDIGKIENYEFKNVIKTSRKGMFIEHITLGVLMINDKMKLISDFDDLDKEKLLSAVLSSHGKYEFASPVEPKTIEAQIVHYGDLIDSQLYYYIKEIDQAPLNDFIFSKSLETNIFTKK